MSTPGGHVEIREMRPGDLDSVISLESILFSTPWSRVSFEAELEKPYSITLSAVTGPRLIGYGVGWVIADEIHIANIAVDNHFQNRGIGKALVVELIRKGGQVHGAFLEVRRSNDKAVRLYENMGFSRIGIRKNYYQEEGEDAILMRKDLL